MENLDRPFLLTALPAGKKNQRAKLFFSNSAIKDE